MSWSVCNYLFFINCMRNEKLLWCIWQLLWCVWPWCHVKKTFATTGSLVWVCAKDSRVSKMLYCLDTGFYKVKGIWKSYNLYTIWVSLCSLSWLVYACVDYHHVAVQWCIYPYWCGGCSWWLGCVVWWRGIYDSIPQELVVMMPHVSGYLASWDGFWPVISINQLMYVLVSFMMSIYICI